MAQAAFKSRLRTADDDKHNDDSHHHLMATTSSSSDQSSSSSQLLFTAGLVADIQYAPVDDGFSFSGTPRYYRHALTAARQAAAHFQNERVELAINLGDLVDGKCQETEKHGGEPLGSDPGHVAVDHVLDALAEYQHGPILHAYGNHCLYNLNRHELQSKLGIRFEKEPCGDLVGYSSHTVENKIRFIVLDSYDVAKMQRCEQSSRKYQQADEILKQNNPNHATNENSPEGLQGLDRRFVAFNGAIGPIQLEWLEKQLEQVRHQHQKAIILSHQPILPESSHPVCLMWNYEQVLDVLRQYSDVVMASFAGHAHKGGYQRDHVSGIHFRVVEGMLEYDTPTYSFLDVYPDRLVVRGVGDCESAEYLMDHHQHDQQQQEEEASSSTTLEKAT